MWNMQHVSIDILHQTTVSLLSKAYMMTTDNKQTPPTLKLWYLKYKEKYLHIDAFFSLNIEIISNRLRQYSIFLFGSVYKHGFFYDDMVSIHKRKVCLILALHGSRECFAVSALSELASHISTSFPSYFSCHICWHKTQSTFLNLIGPSYNCENFFLVYVWNDFVSAILVLKP